MNIRWIIEKNWEYESLSNILIAAVVDGISSCPAGVGCMLLITAKSAPTIGLTSVQQNDNFMILYQPSMSLNNSEPLSLVKTNKTVANNCISGVQLCALEVSRRRKIVLHDTTGTRRSDRKAAGPRSILGEEFRAKNQRWRQPPSMYKSGTMHFL